MISKFIISLMTVQVFTGVLLTFFLKLMDKQIVDGSPFNHPYLQTCISFVGQTFNFALYFYQLRQDKKAAQDKQIEEQNVTEEPNKQMQMNESQPLQLKDTKSYLKSLPFARLLIPACFHAACSMAGFAAYFHMQASISMMLGGCLPVITAILSFFILKKKILKHQKVGMLIIIIGSLFLGFTALGNEEPMPEANPILGIILSISSIVFFGCLMISEEILLKNYQIPGTLLAGCEGLFALIISIICIPLLNLVFKDFVKVELFFSQIASSTILIIGVFGLLFSDMLYTLFCILVTKYSNALTRSIVYQLRCIGVWLVALCLPNPKALGGGQWETFNFMQFIGYILLALGAFIFQELLIIKQMGLSSDIGIKYEQDIELENENVSQKSQEVRPEDIPQINLEKNNNVNNENEDEEDIGTGKFSIE